MAMDFQKYLDEAFSKINIADFEELEPEKPPQDIYREIRELIIYERRKQGISQKELAERSGLPLEELINIENGLYIQVSRLCRSLPGHWVKGLLSIFRTRTYILNFLLPYEAMRAIIATKNVHAVLVL